MKNPSFHIHPYIPGRVCLLLWILVSACSRHGANTSGTADDGERPHDREQVILDYRNGWFHTASGDETIERIAREYQRDPDLVAKLNRLGPKNRPERNRQIYIPPSNSMKQLVPVLDRIRRDPACVPNKAWDPALASSGDGISRHKLKRTTEGLKTRISDEAVIEETGPVLMAMADPEVKKTSLSKLKKVRKSKKSLGGLTSDHRKSKAPRPRPKDEFDWPASGKVVTPFKDGWRQSCHGIEIAALEGTPVSASRSGKVLMAEEFLSYGKLIVIDHGDGYASAYGYNKELLVRPGQHVRKGARIASVGRQKSWSDSMLFFQIRRNASPVDPLNYLN
jgi:murein DD-endopeptidase MepM/ murein hydrolase activator NlpD